MTLVQFCPQHVEVSLDGARELVVRPWTAVDNLRLVEEFGHDRMNIEFYPVYLLFNISATTFVIDGLDYPQGQ